MTKDEAKAAALRWIDEATAGGRALEEETTADWCSRMDHLLDGAVAAVCGRFPLEGVHTVTLAPAPDTAGRLPDWAVLTLPEDCAALQQVWLSDACRTLARYSGLRHIGLRQYAVPGSLAGTLQCHYIRTPAPLGPDAPGDALLDVAPAAAPLVPLRLAADLLIGVDETAVLAGYLAGRYNDLAAAIRVPSPPVHTNVECVYAMM